MWNHKHALHEALSYFPQHEENRKHVVLSFFQTWHIPCWATTIGRDPTTGGINTVLQSQLSSALYNVHPLLSLKIKATVTCLSSLRSAAAPLSLSVLHIPLCTARLYSLRWCPSQGIRPPTLSWGHKQRQNIRSLWIRPTEWVPFMLVSGENAQFYVGMRQTWPPRYFPPEVNKSLHQLDRCLLLLFFSVEAFPPQTKDNPEKSTVALARSWKMCQ